MKYRLLRPTHDHLGPHEGRKLPKVGHLVATVELLVHPYSFHHGLGCVPITFFSILTLTITKTKTFAIESKQGPKGAPNGKVLATFSPPVV